MQQVSVHRADQGPPIGRHRGEREQAHSLQGPAHLLDAEPFSWLATKAVSHCPVRRAASENWLASVTTSAGFSGVVRELAIVSCFASVGACQAGWRNGPLTGGNRIRRVGIATPLSPCRRLAAGGVPHRPVAGGLIAGRGTLAPKFGAAAGAGNRGFAGTPAPSCGFAAAAAPNRGFADAETPNRGFAGEPTLMAAAIGAFGRHEAAVLSSGSPIEAAFCRLRTLSAASPAN